MFHCTKGPCGEVRTLPGGVAAICNPAEWEAYRLHLSTAHPIIILSQDLMNNYYGVYGYPKNRADYATALTSASAFWPSCIRHRKLVTGSVGYLYVNTEMAGTP